MRLRAKRWTSPRADCGHGGWLRHPRFAWPGSAACGFLQPLVMRKTAARSICRGSAGHCGRQYRLRQIRIKASEVADRVLLMNTGQTEQIGSPPAPAASWPALNLFLAKTTNREKIRCGEPDRGADYCAIVQGARVSRGRDPGVRAGQWRLSTALTSGSENRGLPHRSRGRPRGPKRVEE